MADRGSLELHAVEAARTIGAELKRSLPPGVGFAVLVFDIGEKGNLAYVSNAERTSMLASMREFIANAERDAIRSVFEGQRS